MIKLIKTEVLLSVVMSFLLFVLILGAVPRILNYQGKLLNSSGLGVNDTLTLSFRLYTSDISEIPLWEETIPNVTVLKGLFQVELGSIIPFPDSVDFSDTYWLEVTVNSETLSTRRALTAVPYALRALSVESSTSDSGDYIANQYAVNQSASFRIDGNGAISGNLGIGTTSPAGKLDVQGKVMEYGVTLLPRGVILMWYGSISSIPDGWALCDGGDYTAPNGETVHTPDLRDRFIIVAGGSYGVSSIGGNTSHSHTVNIAPFSSSAAGTHTHWVDPPNTTTSSAGSHTHWIDPPNTTTSSVGNHTHHYSGQTSSASVNCNYYTYHPDSYNDICDNHTHSYSGNTSAAGGHSHTVNIPGFWSGSSGNHTHTVNISGFSSGSAGSHSHTIDPPNTATSSSSNMPPYYALAFIMKL